MKISKKILSILFIFFLICACTNKKKEQIVIVDDGEKYLELLKNYEVKEKNSANTVDNDDFNIYLDKVFKDICEDNYLYMHNSISDYKSFGLDKPEVTIGSISYQEDKEELTYYSNCLEELLNFDYDSLSYSQQYDYDMFHYSLLETLCGLYYEKYTLLFNGTSQFVPSLITNIQEFKFYDKESVDDYIVILKDVDRYVDEAIDFTLKQAENNLYHTDSMLDDAISYLDSIIENKGNSLISTFENNLLDLDFLSDLEKEDYKKEAKEIIEGELIDSFVKLIDTLNSLYGKANDEDVALININKNYSEYMFIVNGSNNEDMDIIFNDLEDLYYEINNNYFDAVNDDETIEKFRKILNNEDPVLNMNASDMLEYLRKNTTSIYKDLGDASYVVSTLDTLGSTTLAYFVTPPLDNLNQNVIRVNENTSDFDGIQMYEILAHEGFPGHLYQNLYYQKIDHHIFRATQSFIGYTEGYADMASLDALKLYCDNENVYNILMPYTTSFSHIVYSLIDIGVNYYGWNEKELKEYLDKMGLDSDYTSYYYQISVSEPTLFSRYGIGLVSHLKLREMAKEKLNDKFDYISYHDTILKNGDLPFNILEGAVEEYILANN